MLELFETSPLLRGSISEDDDVVVLGLTADGRVAAVQEQEDRFRGERLAWSCRSFSRARRGRA